jgi:hypothetical protein
LRDLLHRRASRRDHAVNVATTVLLAEVRYVAMYRRRCATSNCRSRRSRR